MYTTAQLFDKFWGEKNFVVFINTADEVANIRMDCISIIAGTSTVALIGSRIIASRSTDGKVDQKQDARQTRNAAKG